MLNRTQIKKNIRQFISTDKCWVDMLVAGIIPILLSFCSITLYYKNGFDAANLGPAGSISATTSVPGLLNLFLSPLTIAFYGYCLNRIRGIRNATNSVYGEAGKNYGTYLGTTFFKTLFTALWSLLFLIPGVVKSYAYSMADFIIHDNPNMSCLDSITLSKKITKGFKGQLFVLDLSFILWYLAAACTLGIANIYVIPYVTATKAAFYEEIKRYSIENGIAAPEEFGMIPVEQVNQEFNAQQNFGGYTAPNAANVQPEATPFNNVDQQATTVNSDIPVETSNADVTVEDENKE